MYLLRTYLYGQEHEVDPYSGVACFNAEEVVSVQTMLAVSVADEVNLTHTFVLHLCKNNKDILY